MAAGKVLTLKVPIEVSRRVRLIADSEGITKSVVIRRALLSDLKRRDRTPQRGKTR
jgi:predicted transcriptional regulator